MNNHVILCGLGELGFRTLERLRAFNEDVVVMDPRVSADFRMQLADLKVKLVPEAGRNPRALREAGILTARAVIAATGDDLKNVGIALAAREENPDCELVVRLFNPRMAEKLQRELPRCRILDVAALAAPVFAYAGLHDDVLHVLDVPSGRFVLKRWKGGAPAGTRVLAVRRWPREADTGGGGLGISIVARPDWDTLPLDARPVLGTDESYGLVVADEEEGARETTLLPAAVRRAARMRWARALRRRLGSLTRNSLVPLLGILALLVTTSVLLFEESLHLNVYQAVYFVVTIMTTVGFGDISVKDAGTAMLLYVSALMVAGSILMAVLYAYVTEAVLSVRLGSFFDRRPVPQRNHFVLFGLGTVGFRIAEELSALGHPMVAIEKQENSRLVERARRLGVKVIVSQDVFGALAEVNLDEARSVLTVTDDDALNLEVALMAQESNPAGRVVVRFFDPHMAGLLERTFGIHLARSPSAIAAPAFAVAASSSGLFDAFDLADEVWCTGRAAIVPGHPFVGLRPADLHTREIMPLTIRQGGGEWRAVRPDEALAIGDELVLVTPHETWLRLQQGVSVSAKG